MTIDEFQKQDKKFIFHLKLKNFLYPVPSIFFKASNTNAQDIAIFVHGLNGSMQSIRFWPSLPHDIHIIGYDLNACGLNKNPASIYYWTYAEQLQSYIMQLKQEFAFLNIKHVYLLGESFGSSVDVMFAKKFAQQVDGILIWNMPRKVINISKSTVKEQLYMAKALMRTWITNQPVYFPSPNKNPETSKLIINNKLMLRAGSLGTATKNDSRSIIAAWRGNFKAWKILLSKDFMLNNSTKLIYVSSEADVLRDIKALKKLDCQITKYQPVNILHYHLQKGVHVLACDVDIGTFLMQTLEVLNKHSDVTNLRSLYPILQEKEKIILNQIKTN